MATPAGLIETKHVNIRELHFKTLEEALAEVDRIAAAERSGTLQRLGNWTTGQVFGHIAYWINLGFDGGGPTPPWFIRLMGPMIKKKILYGNLQKGFRLPGAPEGTYGTENLSLDEGEKRIKAAINRLMTDTPARPNPVFGKMTREEWVALHLRHHELHLGFLVPQS